MNNAATTFEIAPEIRTRLRRMGFVLRALAVVRGMSWVVVAAGAAAVVSFIVDYGLYRLTYSSLGIAGRLAVGLACACGVLLVAWKRLVRVLLRAFDSEDFASLVERNHPELQDRLISAVQYSIAPETAAGASPELVRKVIEEAGRAALPLRFGSAFDAGAAWRAFAAAGAVSLVLTALAVAGAGLAAPWARRNILFRDAGYPKRTVLRVAGANPIRVLRGDLLTIKVIVAPGKFAPRDVTFHFRFPSVGATEERVPASPADPRSYEKSFTSVTEPFSFRVSGSDDKTGEIRVELVEPPEFEDVELEIRSPIYTGVEPRKTRRGAGVVDVPEDGVIVLKGLATKPLSEARVFLDDVPADQLRIAGDGDEAQRLVAGTLAVKASVPFRPSMTLRVELRDTEGFVNKKAASYNLIIGQDQPPACRMETVGIGGEITSNAVLPLAITAKDDYGVFSVHLEMSVQSDPGKVRRDPMYAYRPPEPEPEALRKAVDLRLIARGDKDESYTPPLNVGETLRLQATATDSRPDNPFETRSNLLTFKIVTAEDVASKAVDAYRAVREQISQVIDIQKETRDRCRAAAAEAPQATTLGVAKRETAAAAQAQDQIRDLLANASGRMEAILENLRNNRAIGSDEDLKMRTKVARPLARAADRAAPELARRLSDARRIAGGAALAAELLDIAENQEQRIIRVLEAIVSEMIRLETAEQVERGVRALIRQTEQVRDVMKTGSGLKPINPAPKTR